jgi:quaternary ammonium compound-resistance protein SugE
MSWFILVLAGSLEICWAIGLKYSEGFTRLWPTIGTVFSLIASFVLLGLAIKAIPIGTAYAVWVGIGVVGTTILGIVLFDESVNILKVTSLAFLCVAIIGLKLAHA